MLDPKTAALRAKRLAFRSNSLYYGSPTSTNAYPRYSTAELERDMESSSLDKETRAKMEAEIARRAAAGRTGR